MNIRIFTSQIFKFPRREPRNSPHSTKSQISSNRHRRSSGQSPFADSFRLLIPMDCSRWKALPSGTIKVRRTTTIRLTSELLRALKPYSATPAKRLIFSCNQPRCNFLRLPPFESFCKPNALLSNQSQSTSSRPRKEYQPEPPNAMLKTRKLLKTGQST